MLTMDHFSLTSRIRGSLIIIPRITPGGAARTVKCIAFYGKTPASASIPACKLRLGMATRDSPHQATSVSTEV